MDDILRWVRVVHVAEGLELTNRLGVLVNTLDELLCRILNHLFVCVIPVLRIEVGPCRL